MPGEKDFLPWTEYVYLFLSAMPGGTYAKVGMTNNPDRRAVEFRTASPFKQHQHWICQCPDREVSRRLELAILHTFRANKVRGEWVRVDPKKIENFVAACTAIARKEVSPKVEFREHKPRKPNGEKYKSFSPYSL